MRLFTALWPSKEAGRDLAAALRAHDDASWDAASRGLRGFRLLPRRNWHLTLCFHGDADPDELGERLRDRMDRLRSRGTGFEPPRLRLAGAGNFRSVLWVGVHAEDEAGEAALRELARAAGADPQEFRAHVTVARWRSGRPDAAALTGLLGRYRGPWWRAGPVELVASQRRAERAEYRALRRVFLRR